MKQRTKIKKLRTKNHVALFSDVHMIYSTTFLHLTNKYVAGLNSQTDINIRSYFRNSMV